MNTTTNPIAYAIYGINAAGKHYLRKVKHINPSDTAGNWKLDDDGLDDRWAGNEPLGVTATNPSASELTDERAIKLFESIIGKDPSAYARIGEIVYQVTKAEVGEFVAAIAGQAAPEAPKGHEVRELVNDLRDIATQFHAAQQLRARISNRVAEFFASTGAAPEAPASEQQACRQCDKTVGYVCEQHGEDDEVDAYNHACELMEQFQAERAKRGVEIGTQGSLCDGIAWLYLRLEEMEGRAAAPSRDADLRSGDQVFDLAAPYFAWNAKSWHEATQGTIGMPALLNYTRAVVDAAQAPHAGAALDADTERMNFIEKHAVRGVTYQHITSFDTIVHLDELKKGGIRYAIDCMRDRAAMSAAKQGE